MKLHINGNDLIFNQVDLKFVSFNLQNIFSKKNNKILEETLSHRRYQKFVEVVNSKYSNYLDWNLGDFLFHLKSNSDPFYRNFLNKYGDQSYCHFYIDDETILNKKGLYAFSSHDDLRYIGRCLDSFKKRLNQGYGKIHPKNCFIDGQATNCHLNSLISENRDSISFFVCTLIDENRIKEFEKELISKYNPQWNISR